MSFIKSIVRMNHGASLKNIIKRSPGTMKTGKGEEEKVSKLKPKVDVVLKNESEKNDKGAKIVTLPIERGFDLIPSKKKTLVLDLDETLIHSSFDGIENYSYSVQLLQDGIKRDVFVAKRPFVDEFLLQVSRLFEVVIFTAGISSYANPVIDVLDTNKVCKRRYFRDSCLFYSGYYIKDLTIVQKSLKDVVIIDNSPPCYCLNPNNAVPIESWFDDEEDHELLKLLPLLYQLAHAEDVTDILKSSTVGQDYGLAQTAIENIRRMALKL
ncbi:conserved hypothetical protein [Theileria equi strain WA]|uniref:FCP1 homology domain-containing protein n=1 Tax=Theileria equi strain WA TaxID=1537102 RepID=L1LA35_THEEQ|nr:conserved hypothetical protein [Theileria equi strain WA]EKX72028.1 conserved hypothetical protein [Theileria equi strain WA]|eukprot:XP_004831480.1 conserved hypothetical protein [Theileria equi strain WA]